MRSFAELPARIQALTREHERLAVVLLDAFGWAFVQRHAGVVGEGDAGVGAVKLPLGENVEQSSIKRPPDPFAARLGGEVHLAQLEGAGRGGGDSGGADQAAAVVGDEELSAAFAVAHGQRVQVGVGRRALAELETELAQGGGDERDHLRHVGLGDGSQLHGVALYRIRNRLAGVTARRLEVF